MITSMLMLVMLASCIVENHGTSFDIPDQLTAIIKRLEFLEKKSEQHDQLLRENQMLRKQVDENEARISELLTKVRKLEEHEQYIMEEDDNHFQKELNRVNNMNGTNSYFDSSENPLKETKTERKPEDKRMINQRVETIEKRTPLRWSEYDQVAFYAFLSTNIVSNIPAHHILKFDNVKVNRGLGYHSDDGVFTVPSSGVYVFAWTASVQAQGWASTEIVVNGVVSGSAFADGISGSWEYGTGIVVLEVYTGDHVYIRYQEDGHGVVNSNARGRTAFVGWKLF